MSELHPGPSSRLSHCICKSKTALGRSITPGAGQTVQVVGVLDLVCILKVPLRIDPIQDNTLHLLSHRLRIRWPLTVSRNVFVSDDLDGFEQ